MSAFVKVVENGGFAAAARELGASRSGINKLVLELESALGAQLLSRTTRRVVPTEAGLVFYERSVAILADVDDAESAVSALQGEPRGRLRVNAPLSFGIAHLSPALGEFHAAYPGVELELSLSDRFVDMLAEGFDATVRITEDSDLESAGLVAVPIARLERVVCAAPAYLERYGTPSEPQALARYPCLGYGLLDTPKLWRFRHRSNEEEVAVRVKGPFASNNGEVLRDAAVRGEGIVILPAFIASGALRSGELVPLLTDYMLGEFQLSVLYLYGRHLSMKVRAFVSFMLDRFGNCKDWVAV